MEVYYQANPVNPLLIDDVVEILFEYLKLSDLKRCRLVCHTWCRNATKWLPNRSRQSLLFGDGKKQFETFLKLAKSAIYPLPHRKITLQSSILALNRSQTLESFLKTCSTFIHSLFITYQDESHHITGIPSTAKDFHKYFLTSSVELPVLKHLHYEELPPSNSISEGGGGYPLSKRQRLSLKGHILFDKLLQACVNLERLDLILQDTNLAKTEKHFQSLVNCSSKLGSLRRLRTLMLKLPLHDYHFELLKKAGLLSLSNIQLRFQNEQCSRTSPLRFFESCAGSLQTVSTNLWISGRGTNYFDKDLTLPCLPKVETLEISQWRSYPRNTELVELPFSFSYKTSFPNLRKLTLQSHSWERCWDLFLPLNEICYTLEELKLPKMLENCKGIVIPKISKVFPHLKKLDVTVVPTSVDILTDIFCYLGRLEELNVNFLHDGVRYLNHLNNNNVGGSVTSTCIDYIMTGIPEVICKQIYSEDKIPLVKVEMVETEYSLASLKYLKVLKLKNLSSVNYGIPQFTDITGYLAVMRLQHLRALHIWRSQMSDECILDLEKRFRLFLHPNF